MSSSRFYNKKTSLRKEIDLRSELNKTLKGSSTEIPKAYSIYLRKFRYDNNHKIKCICNQAKEGQRHEKCTVCLGEGYLWDEICIDVFKKDLGSDSAKAGASLLTEIGRNRKSFAVFYIQSFVEIDEDDKLIEIKIDKEGDPILPVRRLQVWQINTLNSKRGDSGRIEFITAYCQRENHARES